MIGAAPLPGGHVIPLQTVLEQRADDERITTAVRKLRSSCPDVASDEFAALEGRFRETLYMHGFTPEQWYRQALAIVEEFLGPGLRGMAKQVNQALFFSSRYRFAEAPQPEILRHYRIGEPIPDAIARAPLSPSDHALQDIHGYLENRLGSTLVELLNDPTLRIEIFIGSREDMLAYYRSIPSPLTLKGEIYSPTSTEFYLFADAGDIATVVIRGISNRSRFMHQLWQLRYAGIELKRVKTRGTFAAAMGPQLDALHRELARLPVKPRIAVLGQRWWPMELLGRLASLTGTEGAAYDALAPTRFRIGPFVFDYLIASVAGAPASRNKVGIVAFRMPNGSLASDAVQALIDCGMTRLLLAGAGGSLDARAGVGSYVLFTDAVYSGQACALGEAHVFVPRLPADFPLVADGRNVTVDSPLEESGTWLRLCRNSRWTVVDVESAHVLAVLACSANRELDLRVTPGLFVSDVVGGDESLTEKISGENAYRHLQPLLESYFTQVGIAGVYDAQGTLHPFAARHGPTNPELVAMAQAVPDVTRKAILGVRLDSEDFHLLSSPKRRVEYPDLQAMGGHKKLLYAIPPAPGAEMDMEAFLAAAEDDKLFLMFPVSVQQEIIELAKRHRYETIVIVEPSDAAYPHADYVVSRDSGWGAYATVVATNAHAAAVFGDPEGHYEALLAMENKGRPIFVASAWDDSPALDKLENYTSFVANGLAAELDEALRLHRLEAWVAKVRPDISFVPLSEIRAYAKGCRIVGVSGSSKIAQFDPSATETALRELLAHLRPAETVFATGGTDYGVEQILHRLIRKEFPEFRSIGFITNEGRGDELGTPAITVAGNDWFGKSVPFLNSIDTLVTVAGGGVIHQELLMAYKAKLPLFPLAGSGMKTDEFLAAHPEVPRYYTGATIAQAIERSAPVAGGPT
jgi:hypothetical protein